MVHYKLYYFPVRAVGELVRQIFAYADVEYEDIRVDHEKWATFKSETPFGQMPVLDVDGKKIPQSYAIARYLASQHGLTGKDNFEAAWVDALADQFKDYTTEFSVYSYAVLGFREGDKDKLRKDVGEPARDKFYPIIEKRLKESSSGFLVGDELTWVDLLLAEHVATILHHVPGFFDAYPEVLKHSKKVQHLPAIAKWIEKRPVTNA